MAAYMGGAPALRNKAPGTIPQRLLAFGIQRPAAVLHATISSKSDDTLLLEGE